MQLNRMEQGRCRYLDPVKHIQLRQCEVQPLLLAKEGRGRLAIAAMNVARGRRLKFYMLYREEGPQRENTEPYSF